MAVGTLEYERRPEVPGQPVRLAPRPLFLAGREGLLAELDVRLACPPGRSGPRVLALCGLGGTGKTSVAIEYAHRHLAEVAVCWQFSAGDPAVLAAEFAVLAAQLGAREVIDPRDPIASVHAVFARQQAEWLVVFDNAADRISVEPFLPPAGPGRVLITTQNQHWPATQALDVPVLGPDVAADFLVNRGGDSDRASGMALALELGGLPLALEQAGAYVRATGTSLAGYLALYQDRQADLLTRGEAIGHPADVAATFGLAMSRLGEEAPGAAGLLRLLAYLAPEPVPLRLLLVNTRLVVGHFPDVAATLAPLLGDPVAAGDAVTALRRYSLVTLAGDGLVLVHRLVQAMTIAQMPEDTVHEWEQTAAALIEAALPGDPAQPRVWPVYAVLLPHAKTVLHPVSTGVGKVAVYLGESGSYATARDIQQDVLTARERALGPEHPDTLAARFDLARWTGRAGDATKARDQFAALLTVRQHVLGPEHPDTLITHVYLARWTGIAGDAAAARDQFAALLPVSERVLGPEHRDCLTARAYLARWTGIAGDAAAARDQFAALLPVSERVLGPEHPDSLTRRANLATWTGAAGDAAGAREQFAALLPLRERILGADHPNALVTRGDLASWTGRAGDADGARDQLAKLLPASERVLGAEHPDTHAVRSELIYWTAKADSGKGLTGTPNLPLRFSHWPVT